jgi:hypothetical protein
VANVHLNTPLHASPVHDGEMYDRCPRDGCGVYDARYVSGSPDHYGWSIHSADARQGGCGATWTRTGRARYNVNQARGVPTQYGTRGVSRDVVVSIPSERFRANYDRIDWTK